MKRMNDAEWNHNAQWLFERRPDQRLTEHGHVCLVAVLEEAARAREIERDFSNLLAYFASVQRKDS